MRLAGGKALNTRRSVSFAMRLCVWGVFFFSPLPALADPAAARYDKPYVGEISLYKAKYEDTMVQIARDHNLGFNELRAANPDLDPWIPGAGAEVLLPSMHILPDAPQDGVVINLPEQRLYYYYVPGDAPITHPIGVGREGLATPLGTTRVMRKKIGPIWRPTPRMRSEDPTLPEQVGPGPDNPMGTHAMYLGWPEYAMHGTNKPYGIGRRSSSGCIRLYPEDIITMFKIVDEGTKVTVVDQPVKAAWIGDDLYLEAHASQAQAERVEQDGKVGSYEFSAADLAVLMRAAGAEADLIDWPAVRKAVRERHGVPVVVAHRISQDANPKEEQGRS